MLIPFDNQLERFEHTTIEVKPIRTLEEALDRMLLPAEVALLSAQSNTAQSIPAAVLSAEEHTAAPNS